MGRLFLWLAVFFFSCSFSYAFENQFVIVNTSIQEQDIETPWQSHSIRQEYHVGSVVDEFHVIVSTYAVAYSKRLDFQLLAKTKRYPLRVEKLDYNANLALLKSETSLYKLGLTPVSFGNNIKLGGEVELVLAASSSNLIKVPSQIKEIFVDSALFSSYPLVLYKLASTNKRAGWSEPVLSNGKFVGMSVSKADDSVYVLPVSTIERFYEQTRASKYSGLALLGIAVDYEVSEALRRYLKLPDDLEGVWIERVNEDSVFKEDFKIGDILTRLGPYKLRDRGYIEHPEWGLVNFVAALSDFRAGDSIEIEVYRDSKKLSFKRELKEFDPLASLIPWDVPREEPYLLVGGLVFQELTRSFLKTWGDEWSSSASSSLLYLWRYQNPRLDKDLKRILVLNKVFADPITLGYESMRNLALKSLNGQTVESIEELKRIVQDSTSDYLEFKFVGFSKKIVLSRKDLAKAEERIRKIYSIPDTTNPTH